IQFLLQWMRNVVSDLQRQMFFHDDVHFDHGLGADMVDPHCFDLINPLIVIDGHLDHSGHVFLLRPDPRQRRNVLERVV
ncbi:hypothetical protein PENTCL1PPCAC_4748, partial [Pristionchus entomophagus]